MSADLDHSDAHGSDDYGYDLVQEVKASLHIPSQRRRPVSGVRATGRQLDVTGDPGGDLGYDLVDCQ